MLVGIFCLEEVEDGLQRQTEIACENNGGVSQQARDCSPWLEPEDLEVGAKLQKALCDKLRDLSFI